ncbi:MAG: membrane protein insertase YidC, partial [Lachnospiraceae bacterium]|nr:membrane protein insertase YidC [Lachnospiraceae bacterium]
MSFPEFLSLLTIKPLELIFEIIYSIANRYTGNVALSIVVLSLVVNLLVLPLYARADKIQAEASEKQKGMEKWVKHIRKTFHGEERLMMLQTYYRQNNYNPLSVLLESVPLLLQVPFFIAAYNFLSGLEMLEGMPLGPIRDLSMPDALFMIGRFPINVLPILMTVINIVSGMIYTKNQTLKLKLQIIGMSLVFLVLLYNSPSGLVFYWTCNNIFSLLKNIVTEIIKLVKKKAA